MYAKDLVPYDYYLPFKLTDVLMVGWLDADHEYPIGPVDRDLITQLRHLIGIRSHDFDVHVNVVRGIHPCNLCGSDIELIRDDGRPMYLGMSEVWFPMKGQWLAAPSLIVHYMESHQYQPPQEFVSAVMALRPEGKIISQHAYDDAVRRMMASHTTRRA